MTKKLLINVGIIILAVVAFTGMIFLIARQSVLDEQLRNAAIEKTINDAIDKQTEVIVDAIQDAVK